MVCIQIRHAKLSRLGCRCLALINREFKLDYLKDGSNQSVIWGGGIDLETKDIDYNSFINIRPNDNNNSNEIQNQK